MALRSGHGHGRGMPRIEVLPADELPVGIPASSGTSHPAKAATLAQVQRTPDGTVADPESAALLGSLGGLATSVRNRGLRVLTGLGLRGVPPATLAPYLADAEAFALSEIRRLAAEVGGGECGPMPSSMVQSAALELAGSRAAFAAGDVLTGSKLAAASRQNLLAAFELAARQGKTKPRKTPADIAWEAHLAAQAAAAKANGGQP